MIYKYSHSLIKKIGKEIKNTELNPIIGKEEKGMIWEIIENHN